MSWMEALLLYLFWTNSVQTELLMYISALFVLFVLEKLPHEILSELFSNMFWLKTATYELMRTHARIFIENNEWFSWITWLFIQTLKLCSQFCHFSWMPLYRFAAEACLPFNIIINKSNIQNIFKPILKFHFVCHVWTFNLACKLV